MDTALWDRPPSPPSGAPPCRTQRPRSRAQTRPVCPARRRPSRAGEQTSQLGTVHPTAQRPARQRPAERAAACSSLRAGPLGGPRPCEAPPRPQQQPTRRRGRQPRPRGVELAPTAVGPARPQGPSCHFHFCLLRPQREVGWGAGRQHSNRPNCPRLPSAEAPGARPRPPPSPGGPRAWAAVGVTLVSSEDSPGPETLAGPHPFRGWQKVCWTHTGQVVCPLQGGQGTGHLPALLAGVSCWGHCILPTARAWSGGSDKQI